MWANHDRSPRTKRRDTNWGFSDVLGLSTECAHNCSPPFWNRQTYLNFQEVSISVSISSGLSLWVSCPYKLFLSLLIVCPSVVRTKEMRTAILVLKPQEKGILEYVKHMLWSKEAHQHQKMTEPSPTKKYNAGKNCEGNYFQHDTEIRRSRK